MGGTRMIRNLRIVDDERGVVSADMIVLAAVALGLATAVVVLVSNGTSELSDSVLAALDAVGGGDTTIANSDSVLEQRSDSCVHNEDGSVDCSVTETILPVQID